MDHQQDSLRQMICAFRVTELQTLLSYAGKNRSGRKNELQARALELVKSRQPSIHSKIRELYESIQLANLAQPPPASAGVVNNINLNLSSRGTYNSSQVQMNSNYNNGRYGSTGQYTGAAEKMLMGRNPFSANFSTPNIKLADKQVPYCPDVKLKKLPFYDILHVLHKPATLIPSTNARGVQDSEFTFYLSPNQADDVAQSKEYNFANPGDNKIQYSIQVQLRFCAMETSCDQDDLFPPSIIVKVNQKLIPLPHPIPSNRPGVEAKRPSRPLNITNYCKLSPCVSNKIQVTWSQDMSGRTFCLAVFMVKKLCSVDLLARLKSKGPRPREYTKGMIKEICMKDDADCCIATTTLLVSIACPLGKSRMALPCRASTCTHLQCFDANLFIQMNEKKPTWACPVCDKPTLFDNLAIDGYFEEVISKVPIENGNEVEIAPDATWKVVVKKEKEDPPTKKIRSVVPNNSNASAPSANKTICIDDDIIIDDDEPENVSVSLKSDSSSVTEKDKRKDKDKLSVEMVDLTLSSDEENEQPPTRSSSKESEPVVTQSTLQPKEKETSVKEVVNEKEPTQQKSSKSGNSKRGRDDEEEGEVNDSSEDESRVRPVRRLPNRQARPTFLHDESSSSSDSSDSSASTRAPDSPQCIVLDSDDSSRSTPSPEPPRKTSRTNSTVASNFLNSGAVYAGAVPSASASTSSHQTHAHGSSSNNSYPGSHQSSTSLPNPRYNTSDLSSGYASSSVNSGYQSSAVPQYRNAPTLAPPPPVLRRSPNNVLELNHPMGLGGMGMGYPHPSAQLGGPFMSYDSRPGWESSGFPGTADFTSLDYPSMDYFNQSVPYSAVGTRPGHPYTGPANPHGSSGGYGGPW